VRGQRGLYADTLRPHVEAGIITDEPLRQDQIRKLGYCELIVLALYSRRSVENITHEARWLVDL
jgi:hypothetical protein